jgi:hypothetical protein
MNINRVVSISIIIVVSILASSSKILLRDEMNGTATLHSTEDTLMLVLNEFARTEMTKDGDGHRLLFVSPNCKMNFALMDANPPVIASLDIEKWIGVFSSWPYNYQVEYSGFEFETKNGIAFDSHHFQGYKDGKENVHGTDLFTFIRTSSGWKILNVSSTIFSDTSHYVQLPSKSTTPKIVLTSLVKAVNERDQEKFLSSFLDTSTPCLRVRGSFDETYNQDLHGATGFFNSLQPDSNLSLEKLDITVKDGAVAFCSSRYSVGDGKKKIQGGEMLATLVFTPENGWKITALSFSEA